VRRFVPIIGWFPEYKWSELRFDLVAGIAVSALVVPKALGYAGIARVPVENGLYAALAGCIVYALFGTSRQISTGPSSALAAVAASAVIVSRVAAGEQTAQLVAAVTIVAGVLFLLGAVLRLGWVSHFLSKPVITGFLFGAAIDVVVGELPKLTGTSVADGNSWQMFGRWLKTIDDLDRTTLLVGVVSLVVVFGLHVVAPRVPGALVLVIGGLVASRVFDLAGHGVATVGHVPRGLPVPALPPADLFRDHFATIVVAGVALFLIGFSQTAGDARAFASRHRYRVDVDQEMVAEAMSNVAAGVLQGMPVSTSLSASSLNDSSGARTQMASIVTGLMVMLTLIILAALFSDLPKPVLAALIIDAVVFGMMDVPEMRRLWRVKRVDFWIAILAIIGVLSAGVLAGVVIGMVLSLGWLVYVNAQAKMTELGRQAGTTAFRPLDEQPTAQTYRGILILRIDGSVAFVTADELTNEIENRITAGGQPVTGVVIDFAGVNFVDSQGSEQIGKLVALAQRGGVSLRLARVRKPVLEVLRLDGVLEYLGANRIHGNIDQAVDAELKSAR
jgi:high affinity sulfate transporter 1